MKTCILDGEKIKDREMLHNILAEDLSLPAWYGRNLDALYDCLTDRQEETRILIKNRECLEHTMGKYVFSLMQALHRASKDNPRVQTEILQIFNSD